MKEKIELLNNEFERIKNVGWILEKRKCKGSAGYTFEAMLKKEEDNFPVPDFCDIEIKTMNKNSKTNLHLFNLTPDGDYLFPIKRILNELGCPSKDDKTIKSFYRSFNSKNSTNIIYGRKGKLFVNYDNKKIEFIVANNKGDDINIGVSWSFEYIKERLELKIKYLALVMVSSCIICGKGYYHYDTIDFYKLKDFDTFIKLMENGIIDITFKIGVHKDGPKMGNIYDHGTDFSIKIEDLDKLYNKVIV